MKIGGDFERNWLSEESIIASCRHGERGREGDRERAEESGRRLRGVCVRGREGMITPERKRVNEKHFNYKVKRKT